MKSDSAILKYDLLVYGSTEAGIFAAVRAAREGLKTAFVADSPHWFGFFPSLGAWETHYPGDRAPLSSEVRSMIIDHYRQTYGANSPELEDCLSMESNNPMMTFEPKVAESVLMQLLMAEPNLQQISRFELAKVHVERHSLNQIEGTINKEPIVLEADYFIDASYNGDLTAATGAIYRLGRESWSEFEEMHAGCVYTTWIEGRFPKEALEGKLNLLPTWTTSAPLPGSTGEGDDAIQDYSYRICLCNNPDNRLMPDKPADYDRCRYASLLLPPEKKALLELPFHHRWLTTTLEEMMDEDHLFHGHALPCRKRSWNATNLTGESKAYAEADAADREQSEARHMSHALGLLFFLQNDPEVPQRIREAACQWGLAKDEFPNSNNLPPVIYIRESRRFTSSYVYREQDCMKHEAHERAPIHQDGIAFTEFALDSLPCRPRRLNASLADGQFFEKAKSLPGSLPWRCVQPEGITNVLTPTNPSVTHCAWGTVRQTASLLQLAESCALAVSLAKEKKVRLNQLLPIELQIHLVKKGMMIGFFNDLEMNEPARWKEAALVFGNYGFFADYNIRPHDVMDEKTTEVWIAALEGILERCPQDSNTTAGLLLEVASPKEPQPNYQDNRDRAESVNGSFHDRLAALTAPDTMISRAQALELMYSILLESVAQRTGGPSV